ncbi:ATP-binding protein [Microbispora triticiradicis]|uniref:ATP-binding protein n=1 Tax=Microbispora triticiradicis TaxID=2200763 RepID=UPI0027DD97C7|nr:ATP-binding protein [Microbispora triticiradicis]
MSASSVVMLPYAPSSVAVARQRLSAELQGAGLLATAVDDVVLILSELLSNALRHAHPLPSGQLKVAWYCSDRQVEVAVSDGGAYTEPRAGRPTLSSLGGRGLGIVEYLAERWGVRHEAEVTTVWAVVLVATPDRNGHQGLSETRILREVG